MEPCSLQPACEHGRAVWGPLQRGTGLVGHGYCLRRSVLRSPVLELRSAFSTREGASAAVPEHAPPRLHGPRRALVTKHAGFLTVFLGHGSGLQIRKINSLPHQGGLSTFCDA